VGRFQVEIKEPAEKAIKALAKKYPKIWEDLRPVVEALESTCRLGAPIKGFAKCYKIRVKSSDIGGGKSHGFRIIARPKENERRVEIWFVYAKPEIANMSPQELEMLLKKYSR
jgi:mRNA-degrading endonuclease RelE of RelBE toxin-antitoxin system